jgi:SAM-dependent methyltransferase
MNYDDHSKSFHNIVRSYYLKILQREPDEQGLNFYAQKLKNNEINETSLTKIFKDSYEFRLLHPTEINEKTVTTNEWMKLDWDSRASDVEYFPGSMWGESEKEYWSSGKQSADSILGLNTSMYDLIIQNIDPKKMKILEIGCGPGRILIHMSKIFGNVFGVDVSSEMINMAKQNMKNITNCNLYENSGSDLTQFKDDYFDFCYSNTVFIHIPKKAIIQNYISETARVLKSGCLFGFNVRGKTKDVHYEQNTWNGFNFDVDDVYKMISDNNFEVIDEKPLDLNDEFYWFMCKLTK